MEDIRMEFMLITMKKFEVKNSLGVFNHRLHISQQKINEFEDFVIKTI